MTSTGRILVWWDREVDGVGRRIRPDARLAAHEIWEQACQRTVATLGDHGPAAELMECAVAQVSRYLDRVGAPAGARKHGLLMVAFCRNLRRLAAKLGRVELAGGATELGMHANSRTWIDRTNARLDLERIVRHLTKPSTTVLMLRAAGFEWKEIARLLGTTPAAARTNFWREIANLRENFGRSQSRCSSDPIAS
jgi:hypothetical protein